MGKVVTKIVKGHVCDAFPFFLRSLLLRLHPEVLNTSLGKMIGSSLLTQPGSALARENVDTFLIPFSVLWALGEEIVIQRPTRHIVQVKRPGLASFGVDQRNASSPLINVALIYSQRRDFTDAQPRPIAQREDRFKTAGGMLFDQLFEHKALFFGKFGGSQSYHGWTLHQARRIAAEVALIDRPPTESAQSRKRLAASTRRTARALEGIHIPTNCRFRHESQMERCPSWLCSQPSHKVPHRGQIGC